MNRKRYFKYFLFYLFTIISSICAVIIYLYYFPVNSKIITKNKTINETKLTERYKTSGIHFISTNNGNINSSIDEMKNSQLKLSQIKKEHESLEKPRID